MRLTTTTTILLPVLAATTVSAQQQQPLVDQLKGWFSRATAAATSLASSAGAAAPTAVPNPANAGAAALASTQVSHLTLQNRKSLLAPGAATASPGIENWMVFVTGGNKSCYGNCQHAETAWNRSVPALAVAKPAVNLALLDCEEQPVLCGAWTVSPPSVYYFAIPQPGADQSQPAASAWYVPLNRTSVTTEEIVALHTKGLEARGEAYEGFWHPLDGTLAKTGLDEAFGYAVWGFGLIPSWAFMIGISMFSRTIMSRRLNPQPPRAGTGAGQATPAASS